MKRSPTLYYQSAPKEVYLAFSLNSSRKMPLFRSLSFLFSNQHELHPMTAAVHLQIRLQTIVIFCLLLLVSLTVPCRLPCGFISTSFCTSMSPNNLRRATTSSTLLVPVGPVNVTRPSGNNTWGVVGVLFSW